jgi:hypothetical protein
MSRLWPIALLFMTACYTYTPLQTPQPGMEVRVRLNGEAAARRSQGLDQAIMLYDGIVVRNTPDSVTLNVLIARSNNAFQDVTIRDTIALQHGEIQTLMERKISASRTALFTVGALVGAIAVAAGISEIVGSTGDTDDPGNPNIRSRYFVGVPLSRVVSLTGRR